MCLRVCLRAHVCVGVCVCVCVGVGVYVGVSGYVLGACRCELVWCWRGCVCGCVFVHVRGAVRECE